MAFFAHPQAIVETERVGEGTRIWAFAHVLPGAVIGRDCNICDHTFIENDVVIGNRVTIKSGVQLWDAIVVEDDVFIGPNATFTNDRYPRSKRTPESYPRTTVRRGASIGANATILPGVTIGRSSMVGAGSVVTQDVPPNALVMGNPGRVVGYLSQEGQRIAELRPSLGRREFEPVLGGVKLYWMPERGSSLGKDLFLDLEKDLPFPSKAFALIDGGAEGTGCYQGSNRSIHRFLICAKGTCAVLVDDGRERRQMCLDNPRIGVHIPPMHWMSFSNCSNDVVLLLLTSAPEHKDDHISEYETFLNESQEAN